MEKREMDPKNEHPNDAYRKIQAARWTAQHIPSFNQGLLPAFGPIGHHVLERLHLVVNVTSKEDASSMDSSLGAWMSVWIVPS